MAGQKIVVGGGLDPEWHRRFLEAAEVDGVNVSELLRRAVKEYLQPRATELDASAAEREAKRRALRAARAAEREARMAAAQKANAAPEAEK
jgi:Arc/MetJ-type ribon-helix-helix transcriptional regulator